MYLWGVGAMLFSLTLFWVLMDFELHSAIILNHSLTNGKDAE